MVQPKDFSFYVGRKVVIVSTDDGYRGLVSRECNVEGSHDE
jgi:hypothetical protein